MKLESKFIFVGCQVGAESALKQEIKRNHPELRLAFSQPGFITFKSDLPVPPGFKLNSILARIHGLSMGKKTDVLLNELQSHVFLLDQWSPEKPEAASTSPIQREKSTLILDEIHLANGETWLGLHMHHENSAKWPGGFFPASRLDEQAPSRAYLKCLEALERFGFDPKSGQAALEIGSAPGGASWALLQKGLKVIGVDPGKMESPVVNHPHFYWIKKSVLQLKPGDIETPIDWVFLDMNVKPDEAISATQHALKTLQNRPQALFLTLKLNTWDLVEDIPRELGFLTKMGFKTHSTKQLSSNAQECTACLVR